MCLITDLAVAAAEDPPGETQPNSSALLPLSLSWFLVSNSITCKSKKRNKICVFLRLELMTTSHPERFAEDSFIKIEGNHIASSRTKNSELVFQQAFEESDNGDTLTDK